MRREVIDDKLSPKERASLEKRRNGTGYASKGNVWRG